MTYAAKTAQLEDRIEEALLAHPDGPIFMSLPRAGVVRAATLLAEIGDCRDRYPDDTALAAAAGVAPSTRQSGNTSTSRSAAAATPTCAPPSPTGPKTPLAPTPGPVNTYRRARGARHPHATRILARAWTRILWRCWHDHQP